LAFDFDAAAVRAAIPSPRRPREISTDDMATLEQAVRVAVGSTVVRHGVRRSEDLQQQAWLEALRAFDNFDPSRGVKLGAHVCGVVRLRLVDWLRRDSPLSRKQIAENQQARRDGRALPWQSAQASFDAPAAQDHFAALADVHTADAFDEVEDRMVAREAMATARAMFADDPRLAFLLDFVVLGGRTMREASAHLGVSASRVEQLVNRSILPALRERFTVDAFAG
jgi:RNA polymerase sigma factor (sigma-70 family)